MPEGDEVRRTARRLDDALAGRRLVRAELRVPRFATVDMTGMTVAGTAVAGKHLLTRLTGNGPALTLHTHLRMEGRWATGAASPRPLAGPHWQVRAWLVSERTQAVGIRLGMVEVLPTASERRIIDRLGPDILGEDWSPEQAAQRLRQCGARPIGEALLDQHVISGLGTIWTSETASTAAVSPWTGCDDVPGLVPALIATREAMQRSLTARSRADRPRYAVYGRAGQPCRRCGTAIRTGRLGRAPTDRVAFWCPRCQPGPGRMRTDPKSIP